jgi:hypothetical protein
MTKSLEHYEIFIKATGAFVNGALTPVLWSWKRFGPGGETLFSGASYPVIEASFAAVRHHAARFGEAPIKINLCDGNKSASGFPQIAAAKAGAMSASH